MMFVFLFLFFLLFFSFFLFFLLLSLKIFDCSQHQLFKRKQVTATHKYFNFKTSNNYNFLSQSLSCRKTSAWKRRRNSSADYIIAPSLNKSILLKASIRKETSIHGNQSIGLFAILGVHQSVGENA